MGVVFLTLTIFLILSYRNRDLQTKKSLTIKRIDPKGIFIGQSDLARSGKSKLDHLYKEIDYSWDNIGEGKDYYASGDYEHAAEAFRQAYLPTHGEKAVAGLNLALSYEKLGRYEEGITLLNQMIKNRELSEKGIQNANEIKSRLLAAKAQTQQNVPQANSSDAA